MRRCADTAMQLEEFQRECTPGYYNNEGKPGERRSQDGWYGGGCVEFFELLHSLQGADVPPGIDFSAAQDGVTT